MLKKHSNTWNPLNHLSVLLKILILVSLPFSAFTFLAVKNYYEKVDLLNISKRDLMMTKNLARPAAELVHELQKERGMSAGFLGSKGQSFA